jgi:hypothetical protein
VFRRTRLETEHPTHAPSYLSIPYRTYAVSHPADTRHWQAKWCTKFSSIKFGISERRQRTYAVCTGAPPLAPAACNISMRRNKLVFVATMLLALSWVAPGTSAAASSEGR